MSKTMKQTDNGAANAPSPISPNQEISLPSFRDGIAFKVRPLNFGGVKAMLSVEKLGPGDMVSVMVQETLKREFPNVTTKEVDELEQGCRHDSQRPFGTYQKLRQVVSGGVLSGRAASPYHRAVDQDCFEAEDPVPSRAVLAGPGAGRVFGDVAANLATVMAGRVGGVEEALLLDGPF